ncbi:MAG: four helix bundle protein [Candidatus Moranbacteria bacterium]|jgi:four helix bundle protein|nr:four helix bundle protein [Candidatus Moranbacteria bacterium]MDD5652177.1 four helix bundle protein [Candidatus Moranbacteria bacterium]MDX9855865.1 four helix bundle protein [Candidatus Moranbacteria bacterium]
MSKNYLKLGDLNAYKISLSLSNYVWDIVLKWDYFPRDTVGKQWVRSVDSISANIAEGFGRYTKKDKVNFYRYSFGSLKESQDWTFKAKTRNLIDEKQYKYISDELEKLPKEINHLIKFTNDKLKK